MEEREYSNIYIIPPNYTNAGRLFGGLLETRNAVEAGFLVFLVGYPELMWLPVSSTLKIVLMTVTLLPLGIIALTGIGGDSVLQYVFHMLQFWFQRKKLHFRRLNYRYDPAKYKLKKAKAKTKTKTKIPKKSPAKTRKDQLRPGLFAGKNDPQWPDRNYRQSVHQDCGN